MNADELMNHIASSYWNNEKNSPYVVTMTRKEWKELNQMVKED